MIAGGLASVLTAAWKFLRTGEPQTAEDGLDSLYTLGRRIRETGKDRPLALAPQQDGKSVA
jgi:hypothetical protein